MFVSNALRNKGSQVIAVLCDIPAITLNININYKNYLPEFSQGRKESSTWKRKQNKKFRLDVKYINLRRERDTRRHSI